MPRGRKKTVKYRKRKQNKYRVTASFVLANKMFIFGTIFWHRRLDRKIGLENTGRTVLPGEGKGHTEQHLSSNYSIVILKYINKFHKNYLLKKILLFIPFSHVKKKIMDKRHFMFQTSILKRVYNEVSELHFK